jgi:uncharacterized glyoxalase superfamily protein PhnB
MSGEGTARGGRIIPALRYRNAAAAIDWLCDAFGFERKMVVPGEGGRVAHAELTLGNGMIMLGDVKTEYGRLVAAPVKGDPVTQGIYVVVEDADAHYTRAKAAGAEIVLDIKTQDYGGRDYTARDLEAMSGPSALTILGRAEWRRPA